jgi:hypothetical protein
MANTPYDVLLSYEQKFIDAIKKSLEKNGKISSDLLSASVKAPVKIMGQKVVMEIKMLDYWKFVNDGVDGWGRSVGSQYKYKKGGKPIPLDAMLKHISLRGISPAMNIKRGRTLSGIRNKQLKKAVKKDNQKRDLENTAWAMGYMIKKRGVRPSNFLDEVLESNLIKDMQSELSKSVGRMIKVELSKVINDGNNN